MNSHRRRQVRLGAVLVLLLAVLPNVMYIGHRGEGRENHVHTRAEAAEHANHCHGGPSQCGGGPSLVNAWMIGGEGWSLIPGAVPQRIESGDPARADDPSLPVDTPPPRYA